MTRAGFVALAGLPNAGKSTLLNRLVGGTLAITSPKPQTTRDRIVGIVTSDETQFVFVDTPGLMVPEYELHARMRASALKAVRDADVVVHVADATAGVPPSLWVTADVPPAATPLILALCKADLLSVARRNALAREAPDATFLSAVTGDGIEAFRTRVAAALPESPFLYPVDDVATQPLRFFVAEFVREAALEQLQDEVPYSIACVIEEFREERSPVYIRATLFVERESQKRILIGANGAQIRLLGSAARPRIEALVGGQVYLDLWVKVQPHWRREPHVLDRLGYGPFE